MEVKAVKAITEVTLALTGEDAEIVANILISTCSWDGSRTGRLAETLYQSLLDAGVEDRREALSFNNDLGYFEETR